MQNYDGQLKLNGQEYFYRAKDDNGSSKITTLIMDDLSDAADIRSVGIQDQLDSFWRNMAYFQLDKNPKRKLETSEDYDKYARACYKQAMHFSVLCIRNQDLIVSEHCMAWYTNVAFSCELFFKYYLFCIHADSKTFIKKHDLFELFTLLPEELQKDIIKCHPEKDITRDMFELNLKELGKAFTEFRYSYEKDSMAFSAQFLAELFAELYERTEPLKE